ncbi:MAG: hypothetical protein ACFE68_05360 [Candidatus Hodarchaeota archaeon]
MKVKKTIKAKIMHLTKVKQRLLEEEYDNLQRFLHGEPVKLYSANKQQTKRFYKKIKPDKEYPISVRKDLLKVERRDTKIADIGQEFLLLEEEAEYGSPLNLTAP